MSNLEKLRAEIDSIDEKIFELLVKRQKISKTIGEYKAKNSLPVKDAQREETLLTSIREKAEIEGQNPDFFSSLFKKIMEESKRNQQ